MQYYYFAANYGENTYNSDVYNGSTTTGGTTGTATGGANGGAVGGANGSANGGSLANTGFEIAVAVTLASLIIVVAVLVRFARRRTPVAQEISAE